ncbi:hypothetical protein [Acinetobacter pittii]|uniref:hypothetical protein n=1 Tax=Acinetobacter pittii TaxID=48296 RepID=UPI00300B4F48
MQIQIIGGLFNSMFIDDSEMKNPNYEKRVLKTAEGVKGLFYVDKELDDKAALKLILINECC